MKLLKQLFFSAIILTASIAFAQDDAAASTLINKGDKAPQFNVQSLSGELLSSDQLNGKVTLINFWATWCPPCRADGDKEEKKAKRINYIETDRFIASLEKEFHIEVELNFSLNEPSIAGGELAILFPPTTEHQRVRNVKSSDERFQVNTTEFETRSLIKSLIIGDTTGKQSLKYSFSARTQNIRYYITDEYLAKKESITSDLHPFQKFPEAAKGKNTTFFLNKLFDGRLYNSNFSSLSSNLLTNGFPVKPALTIKFDSQGNSKISESLNSYILNFGWIPINEVKLSSGETSRSFVKSETTVDLVHSTNFEILKSPLFFRKSKSSPWINLDSEIKISTKKQE